jgi:hypothetical protein
MHAQAATRREAALPIKPQFWLSRSVGGGGS